MDGAYYEDQTPTCFVAKKESLLEMLCYLDGISAINEGQILLNNFGIRMPTW